MTARKQKNIRCDVCRSLLLDRDWRRAGGYLVRGAVRIDPDNGEVEVDGVNVPLRWLERRCVLRALRKRAEQAWRVHGFDPRGK